MACMIHSVITLMVVMSTAKPEKSTVDIKACHDKFSKKSQSYINVVDVLDGSSVHVWCHFCTSKEDYFPKLWFFKQSGTIKFEDIPSVFIERNEKTLNFTVNPAHVLIITNFNFNNSGIYKCFCRHSKYIYKYALDNVFNAVGTRYGSAKQWLKYKREWLDTKTKVFKLSEEQPYKTIREVLNISLKLVTKWENWPKSKDSETKCGPRKRLGICRLRSYFNGDVKYIQDNVMLPNALLEKFGYLNKTYDISCRSKTLYMAIPEISTLIKDIPDYEMRFNLSRKGSKQRLNKTKNKFKSTQKKVTENSHVALWCTEFATINVEWFKDKKLLNSELRNNSPRKEEGHVSVDSNNTLHIFHITKDEGGVYSCVNNGKKIQEIEIIVVSLSEVLNQEFFRYSMYLGFILSITMTCYCAGICVAWNHQGSFAEPQEKTFAL